MINSHKNQHNRFADEQNPLLHHIQQTAWFINGGVRGGSATYGRCCGNAIAVCIKASSTNLGNCWITSCSILLDGMLGMVIVLPNPVNIGQAKADIHADPNAPENQQPIKKNNRGQTELNRVSRTILIVDNITTQGDVNGQRVICIDILNYTSNSSATSLPTESVG